MVIKDKDKLNIQPSLNNYFTSSNSPSTNKKRNLSNSTIIILSSDEEEEEDQEGGLPIASTSTSIPSKRIKLESNSTSKSITNNTKAAEKVAKFRFNPDQSSNESTIPPTEEQIKRRNEFIKRLGNINNNRTSNYLQPDHYLGNNQKNQNERSGGGEENEEEEDESEEEEEVIGKGKGKSISKGKGKEKEVIPTSKFSKFVAKGASSSSSSSTTSTSKDKGKGKEVIKYTPLELQVIELKKQNPGVVLMVEVGYKMKFFGEDALIASKCLSIAAFPSHNFMSAMIPVHRINVHLKRLINEGNKVGVVRQIETAALKKIGDNKNAPFTRALTSLTTSATFIDDELTSASSIDDISLNNKNSSSTATLLCVVEEITKDKSKEDGSGKIKIGLIAVMPSTGEVIYDEFQDGFTRSELETRLLHLQPSELILPKTLSKPTESLISYHIGQHSGIEAMTCRIERVKKPLSQVEAFNFVSNFYNNSTTSKNDNKKKNNKNARKNTDVEEEIIILDSDEDEEMSEVESKDPSFQEILSLPPLIHLALTSLINYLEKFSLSSLFLQTSNFSHFNSRSIMTLNANSITNLEVLRNNDDFKEGRGTLLGVVDRCKTAFGRRLLRKWVKGPLVNVSEVNERLNAVTEINTSSGSLPIVKIRKLLNSHLLDLERGLIRIYFNKIITSQEILRILDGFKKVSEVFTNIEEEGEEGEEGEGERDLGVKSSLLRQVIRALPKIKEKVEGWLGELNIDKAREGKMEEMFKESGKLESLQDAKDNLGSVEYEMEELLNSTRKFLKKPKLEFSTIAQEEFLIQLTISESNKLNLPQDWLKISNTKTNFRWRSPEIHNKMQEINQAREHLTNEAKLAFKNYLISISTHYEELRSIINQVALVDCLYSLASLAQSPGYCRPTIVSEAGRLDIIEGRSPIVEVLLVDPFVPNTVLLGGNSTRQQILTGINMGGKSTLAKSVALIALLAQIGSYCPAKSVTTSLFDGIYTRMGASDDLARGRSTFMVEMSETSEILKLSTPRSLIILDELGRGTSTHDGQAIASSVLEHIITKIKSLCLFVTHYPSLSELSNRYPESCSVHHMACLEEERQGKDFADVVFLYKLKDGLASRSHGLNVARLSNLPDSVLKKAAEKSREIEEKMKLKTLHQKAKRVSNLLKVLKTDELKPEKVIELAFDILHQGGE